MFMLSKKLLILLLFIVNINLAIASQDEENREVFVDEVFAKNIKKSGMFKVAVLPIQNMSMYPNIAYYFRQHLNDLIAMKGYSVISTQKIDKALYEVGVQKADHIRLLNFDKLADMTSADAIMSGIIETATIQDAGVYSGYAFTGSLKLQLRNGDTIWYSLSQRVAKRHLAIDPFNIVVNILVNQESDKQIKAIKAVAQKLVDDLPQGPNEVVIDNLLGQAIEL
ncbi:MAG: DUF799 family lipoprotein [Campylobacterota bacterium]|nr:DUF799 family lipoprotein [Campylobacterota bacterium]